MAAAATAAPVDHAGTCISVADKAMAAKALLADLVHPKGVWASTSRYRNQCWTRDFCLALAPCLDPAVQEAHLDELVARQHVSGKIPILYLDDALAFLREKVYRSVKSGQMSFMLKRYLEEDGNLENLTPATRDSEVLFVIAALSVNPASTKYHVAVSRALEYVYSNLLPAAPAGAAAAAVGPSTALLFRGGDWRDNREDLHDKFTLTNACLWYRACFLASGAKVPPMPRAHEAKEGGVAAMASWSVLATHIADHIRTLFWNPKVNHFHDYLPHDSSDALGCGFDLLGNSLTVLFDIASHVQTERLLKHAQIHLATPYGGYRMSDTFLPALGPEEKAMMERDKAVIWPWTSGFLLLAMCHQPKPGGTGAEPEVLHWRDVAREQCVKWAKQEGFFEWYSVSNGKGYGSPGQAWTAALFIRVKTACGL